MLRRYKLACSTTTTTNSVDSFIAARKGILKGVEINVIFDSVTDNGSAKLQVSRSAIGDFVATASGAITQAICQWFAQSNFVTSGLAQTNHNIFVPCGDVINIGDPLYLNLNVGGTATVTAEVLLVIEES